MTKKNFDKLLNRKIFFFDIDGTLLLENKKIESAFNFVRFLKENGKIIYLLTNNSSKTPNEHLQALEKENFTKDISILSSLQASLDYFKSEKINKIAILANKNVSNYILEKGFIIDNKKPEALLLTYDTEINYAKLLKFINLVKAGIPYYASHIDLVCPTKQGNIPDIGSFINLIQSSTHKLPIKYFGKPDKNIIKGVLKKHNLNYKEAVIIGDRLYTDIKLAENSQILSVLVTTGATSLNDYKDQTYKADFVVNSLEKLIL